MHRAPAALFVFLAAHLAACNRSEPPPAQPLSTPAPAGATADEKAFLALLPASGAAAGWSRAREARRYGQADLWEYIDGAAEAYLAFGFQELATAGYAHAGSEFDATADVFKMADPVNAFGVFAEERPASCEGVRIGVEACYAGGALSFWSGPYFVKLTAFKDSGEVRQALTALAAAVVPGLGNPGSKPAQLDWLPTTNLVPRSARYVPKDVLGQPYLTNAFEAQYADGPRTAKLTAIAFDSAEAAGRALADYRAFIESSGKPARALKTPGDGGFTGIDAFYGIVVAARSGSSFAIALGVTSEKAGAALIDGCFARMKDSR